MAILEMKKLRLAVTRANKDALLKALIREGCVQFNEVPTVQAESENEDRLTGVSSDLVLFKSGHDSLTHAIELFDKYQPVKTKLLSAKPELEREAFLDETGLSDSLLAAEQVEKLDMRIRQIGTEISREKSNIEALTPWTSLDLPMDFTGTERTTIELGTLPVKLSPDTIRDVIGEISEEAELYEVSRDKTRIYLVLLCINEDYEKVSEAVKDAGFTTFSGAEFHETASDGIRRGQEQIKALEEEEKACREQICAAAGSRDEIKLAADKMAAKMSMEEATERFLGTETTLFMEGWIPAEKEEKLSGIFETYDCAWETVEPEQDEYPDVPVKLKNNKFTNALNMVTDMYSLPAYGTVDPNPLMAPFFILFYGLMMADMGYGILMIVGALVAMKKIKPRKSTLSFCQLLLYCGIATFAMGALTGGFFSDVPYQLVHLFNPNSTWKGLPYLFSPVYNSEMVLYGSMVLGALHLNAGMVINFVRRKKAGDLKGAIFEEGSLWVVLIGGILAVLGIGNIGKVPVVLVIGLVLLLFGAGREAKGFGKVTAAFSCIYNTATGWFGDVLSYSRIMALMLAGGVVGQVFNTVAVMPAQNSGINVFTMAAFVVIFLLGHAMNFALNILGCYVHDLRLQCLEFFGKFYEDGGKPFTPLDINGKYLLTKEMNN